MSCYDNCVFLCRSYFSNFKKLSQPLPITCHGVFYKRRAKNAAPPAGGDQNFILRSNIKSFPGPSSAQLTAEFRLKERRVRRSQPIPPQRESSPKLIKETVSVSISGQF